MDLNDIVKMRQKMIEEYGWVVDAVYDTEDLKCETGTGCNIHTHGILESFNHADLQCILPIDQNVVHSVFCVIVNQIKSGKKFESGKCYNGILGSYKIRFISAIEEDREVLRVILPDDNGKLHKQLMQESFKVQYNGIEKKG